MSDLGAFVSGWEGFQPRAKWDYKQYTNGYGTRAQSPSEVIDETEAKRRLQQELDQARSQVVQRYPSLAPHQTDALTSFTYNLGPGWMSNQSRLSAAVAKGDMAEAARIMQEYNKAGGQELDGLKRRRMAEGQMLLGGPPAVATPSPQASSAIITEQKPMPDSDQTEKMGFFDRLAGNLQTPLAQGGIALLLDGMAGGRNPAGAFGSGFQSGLAAQHQLAELAERRRRIAEEQKARDALMSGLEPYTKTLTQPPASPMTQPVQAPQALPGATAAPAQAPMTPAPSMPVGAAPGIGISNMPKLSSGSASPSGLPIMDAARSTAGQPSQTIPTPNDMSQGGRTVPRQAVATSVAPDTRASDIDNEISRIDQQVAAASKLLSSPYTATLGLTELSRLQGRRQHLEDLKIARSDPSEALKRRALELSVRKGELDLEAPTSQFHVIGQDPLGNPQYGFVDPRNQTVRPATIDGQPSTPSLLGSNVHGEEYLATLPPQIAAQIRGLADGRIPYPTGMAAWKPQWRAMEQHLAQYDPQFDAVNYAARNQTRKDFTSGVSARNITSFNTAIGHLGHLNDAIDGLNNTPFPMVNSVWNTVARNISPNFAARENNFGVARTAVTEELARAFKGMGATQGEVHEWEKRINSADSPQALRASVAEAVKLLESRINSMGESYNRGMGTTKDPLELLTPDARATLAKLKGEKPQRNGPEPGTIENGYVFKGGNPADKSNWERKP